MFKHDLLRLISIPVAAHRLETDIYIRQACGEKIF